MNFNKNWAGSVVAICDPVFAATEANFLPGRALEDSTEHVVLLWEAPPAAFARAFPTSGIEDEYGDQWPEVPCIDFEVVVSPSEKRADVNVEGWSTPSRTIPLSGDPEEDGHAIADYFSGVLLGK